MRKFTAYRCPKSPDVWDAIVSAFQAQPLTASSFLNRNTIAIVGGLEYGSDTLLREIRTTRHPHVFVDGGYLKAREGSHRNRFRIVPNAFNQYWINESRADERSRFAELGVRIVDWRKNGSHILICTSSSKNEWFFGTEHWVDGTLARLRELTDRPVVVRRYEDAAQGRVPAFAEQLKDCWAVICHGSTASVEAALAGVPVFVAPENPALPVASSDLAQIEQPAMPDRQRWANALAWSQFTLQDIDSGRARDCVEEAERCRPPVPRLTVGWRDVLFLQGSFQ